jgi:hypothetical protein
MDIPSPEPIHHDHADRPGDNVAPYLLGSPTLVVDRVNVSEATNRVTIINAGQGILAWRAKPGQSWITVDQQGGVALGANVVCDEDAPCERSPTLTITVTRDDAGPGFVDIESLTTGQVWRVNVVRDIYDANCDGTSSAVDALIVLQFSAARIPAMPCERGDVNDDGIINVLDATIILQYTGGLL